jgi:hypothetical protein
MTHEFSYTADRLMQAAPPAKLYVQPLAFMSWLHTLQTETGLWLPDATHVLSMKHASDSPHGALTGDCCTAMADCVSATVREEEDVYDV